MATSYDSGDRTSRRRCDAPRRPTASTRSGSARRTRTGPTGTPRTWCARRPARSCRDERRHDYDVIVLGARLAGRALRRGAGGGRPAVAVVERELVGGECSYWACIPSKSLLRPGEAVHEAREAAASAEVDVEAALAWRDFMVSD